MAISTKHKTQHVTIRLATASDADVISDLIITVASAQLRGEFTQDGWDMFQRLISKQTQQAIIKDSNFRYYLATDSEQGTKQSNEKIVGLISSKNQFHLFHFFILPDYQKRGIGTQLWQHFLKQLPNKDQATVTVKSSDFALNFYKTLGFCEVQPRTIKNGLVYTLLNFVVNN